jgi:predicted Zn-dependent peptidase
MPYRKTILENGITILSQKMNHIESISLEIWVRTGSRYENKENNGISHFIEHMHFKGTNKRSAKTIAEEFDSIGGYLNAFTGQEFTAYVARVLKEHLPLSIDIMSDILLNSLYDDEKIENEKEVILQEIALLNDTPDSLTVDNIHKAAFPDQELGLNILGEHENVKKIDKKGLLNYHNQYYTGSNIIIVAAGNLEHDNLVKLVSSNFNKLNKGNKNNFSPAVYQGGFNYVEKDLEQIHFCLGLKGSSYLDKDFYTAELFSNILGGNNMSSRLYQKIREEYGLVYGVSSFNSSFQDTGMLFIYNTR